MRPNNKGTLFSSVFNQHLIYSAEVMELARERKAFCVIDEIAQFMGQSSTKRLLQNDPDLAVTWEFCVVSSGCARLEGIAEPIGRVLHVKNFPISEGARVPPLTFRMEKQEKDFLLQVPSAALSR